MELTYYRLQPVHQRLHPGSMRVELVSIGMELRVEPVRSSCAR